MKKNLLALVIVVMSMTVVAQQKSEGNLSLNSENSTGTGSGPVSAPAIQSVPQQVSYQAVARDATGAILAHTPVSVKFVIHDSIATGTAIYTEVTGPLHTNQFGLFTTAIGTNANLGTVAWGNAPKWLQVLIDINNTGSYTDMGTTQLNAVPYALYAANAPQSNSYWTAAGGRLQPSDSTHALHIGDTRGTIYSVDTVLSIVQSPAVRSFLDSYHFFAHQNLAIATQDTLSGQYSLMTEGQGSFYFMNGNPLGDNSGIVYNSDPATGINNYHYAKEGDITYQNGTYLSQYTGHENCEFTAYNATLHHDVAGIQLYAFGSPYITTKLLDTVTGNMGFVLNTHINGDFRYNLGGAVDTLSLTQSGYGVRINSNTTSITTPHLYLPLNAGIPNRILTVDATGNATWQQRSIDTTPTLDAVLIRGNTGMKDIKIKNGNLASDYKAGSLSLYSDYANIYGTNLRPSNNMGINDIYLGSHSGVVITSVSGVYSTDSTGNIDIQSILSQLPSYVNDAAAATAGLPIGSSYYSTTLHAYTRREL